ncbi:MAG: hypothetical protein KTR24_17040, partial [Saprospiraceae bacterium]|nr:hypothetical protein [Saprospiraceae bacterium]
MALADTALHLSQVLDIAYPALSRFDIPRRSASHKAGGWTNHQILGHLVDSAANNHQKFVRLAASPRLSLDGYGQDDWVSMQRYE